MEIFQIFVLELVVDAVHIEGVGAKSHLTIQVQGEMDAQKNAGGIRNRIDQMLDILDFGAFIVFALAPMLFQGGALQIDASHLCNLIRPKSGTV